MGKTIKITIASFGIIVVLIVFNFLGWLKPIENLVFYALTPVQKTFYGLGESFRSIQSDWLLKRKLLGENAGLKEQLKKSLVDQSLINSLSEENQLLKKDLKFVAERKINFLSAQIITGVSDPLSQSIIINRGAKDGVTRGLAVTAEGGIMIGKVIDVSDYFSKVLLLTDNKSTVASTVQNTDRTSGLVEGQFGLSFSMTNIPQDQPIKEDDLVVTSGLEGQIPKNLLIARVERVNQKENEIFKTAILKPIADFNNLSDVLVILPN